VTDEMVMSAQDRLEAESDWPIPPGRRLSLRGRGTTFVREVEGPPGAPTVLLHHGWGATGGLNWFPVFEPLAERFRVVTPDLRGHGRGLRSRRVFRLADCADDSAATLLELDAAPAIVVGYSMGGPISQLLWRRDRDLVRGLVLCATSAGFFPGTRERMVVEAGHSIGTYHAPWVAEIDVPTVVIVTTQDRLVDPDQQYAMAAAIPNARVVELPLNHLACTDPDFVDPLVEACEWVNDQAQAASTRTPRSRA